MSDSVKGGRGKDGRGKDGGSKSRVVTGGAISERAPHRDAGVNGDRRKSRWADHREQRRHEFVLAAMSVLSRDGPDLAMDAVAAQAGVTKPVLYRYFEDKAALVEALGELSSGLLLDRLIPAMRAPSPPVERIREAVGAYFALIDEHPNLYWLLARWPGGGVRSWHRDRELIATTLTAILGDYLRVFRLDSGGAEPWAYGITGLVQSTGEWWLVRRSMNRAHVVDYVTRLIWAALSGVLREAGVTLDPAGPLPPVRPSLTSRRGAVGGSAAGEDVPAAGKGC